jgi:hypothetical protein
MCIIGNNFWKRRNYVFVVGVELINKMTNGTEDKEIRESPVCTVYVYVYSRLCAVNDEQHLR